MKLGHVDISTSWPNEASIRSNKTQRSDRLLIFLILTLIAFGIWANSGTLSPYAATLDVPLVKQPCKSLFNIDHPHFEATYRFLDGAPPETWSWSVVLRRVLYPILAYPFMKMLGFEVGGIVTSLLLNLFAVWVFLRFISARYEYRAVALIGVLLATYPGLFYWASLPYSYAMIVPCSLLSWVALIKLNESERIRETAFYSAVIGVLALGYDLLPYFAPAACLIRLLRRDWLGTVVTFICLCLPQIITLGILYFGFGISALNDNTAIYAKVINAYFDNFSWIEFIGHLEKLPGILTSIFLGSNFLFLPLLALVIVLMRVRSNALITVEALVLISALLILLISNLAPIFDGWQIRGSWVARLYQPVFVVYLWIIVRAVSEAKTRWRWITIYTITLIAVFGQALITYSPYLNREVGARAYWYFYAHSSEVSYVRNIESYGVRPLGVCQKKPKRRKLAQS